MLANIGKKHRIAEQEIAKPKRKTQLEVRKTSRSGG
jgi:hypothetical protein